MLSYYNKRPPKPVYINKILKALGSNRLMLSQIQIKTSLTRTQVACSLDNLIAEEVVDVLVEKGKKCYGIRQLQ